MENVLDRGFSKFKGTESKERSRRAIQVAGAHERKVLGQGLERDQGPDFPVLWAMKRSRGLVLSATGRHF